MELNVVQQSLAAVEESLGIYQSLPDDEDESAHAAEGRQQAFDTLLSDLGRLASAAEASGARQEIDGAIWQLVGVHDDDWSNLRPLYGYSKTKNEIRLLVCQQIHKRSLDAEYRARQLSEQRAALKHSPHIRMKGINS